MKWCYPAKTEIRIVDSANSVRRSLLFLSWNQNSDVVPPANLALRVSWNIKV